MKAEICKAGQSDYDWVASLAESTRNAFLAALGEKGMEWFERSWHCRGRPEQLPPEGDWSTWLIMAGRGFGKTRAGAEWARGIAERDGAARIALVGASLHDARSIMVEGRAGCWRSRRRTCGRNGGRRGASCAGRTGRGPPFTARPTRTCCAGRSTAMAGATKSANGRTGCWPGIIWRWGCGWADIRAYSRPRRRDPCHWLCVLRPTRASWRPGADTG